MHDIKEATATTSRRSLLRKLITAGVALVGWSRTGLTQTRTTASALEKQAKGVGQRLMGSAKPNYAEFDRFLEEAERSTFSIELIYAIFRESVKEQQQDEKYFLQKLNELNEVMEEASERNKALADAYMEYADERSEAVGKDEGECNPAQARATAARLDRHLRNVEAKFAQLNRRTQQRLDAQGLLALVQRDRTIIAKLQKAYRMARCD